MDQFRFSFSLGLGTEKVGRWKRVERGIDRRGYESDALHQTPINITNVTIIRKVREPKN